MNSRRKAPMPQCSFQIRKGPFEGHNTTTAITTDSSSDSYAEHAILKSYLHSSDGKNTILQTITTRDTSPHSIIDEILTADIKSKKSYTATGTPRFISPMRRHVTPPKTALRRANSFDDSFGHILATDQSTLSSPQRAKKRKDMMQRSSSLPSEMKKNVMFDEKCDTVHEIERICDLPADVIIDMWWTGEDYQNIKRDYEAIVYLLDQNIEINEDDDSARGLHQRTELGAWEMYEKQRNARNAVLHQQDIHRKQKLKGINIENISIDVAIAQVYMDQTLHLRDEAIQKANNDYDIAMNLIPTGKPDATEVLDDSITDITMTISPEKSPTPEAINHSSSPKRFDATIRPPRRSCSDNYFVDSMLINGANRNAIACQPISMQPTEEQSGYNSVIERSLPLVSVFEESLLIVSDEDDDVDEEESDCKTPTDDDARSTEAIPIQVDRAVQLDHAVTKVSFSSKIQKMKRIKVKDIESDTKRRWYSNAELIDIATNVNSMVDMIEKERQSIDSDVAAGTESKVTETRRGLEKSTELGARKLYDRRRYALNVVLTIQSHQQQQCSNYVDSSKCIAEAYIAATEEARQEAIKFGKQDTKEARKHRIKRRSTTTSEHDLPLRDAIEQRRNSSGGRLQSRGTDEEDRSVTCESNRERSISPPLERLMNNSNEDANDYSMRSILNLNIDPDDLHDDIDTTSVYNVNYMDNVNNNNSSNGHRLSESHAPSRRFVQAAAELLDRQVKLLGAKQKSTMNFTTQQRVAVTAPKQFRYPYDSTARDDSTNNDETEGIDVIESKNEPSLQASIPSVREVLSTATDNEVCTSNDDSFVWFKVKPSDIKEMTLANGIVVHVLRNAVQHNKR